MYRCTNCDSTMNYPYDICPSCGALLLFTICEGCGHVDYKNAFINNNNRCPKCNSVIQIDDCSSGLISKLKRTLKKLTQSFSGVYF